MKKKKLNFVVLIQLLVELNVHNNSELEVTFFPLINKKNKIKKKYALR